MAKFDVISVMIVLFMALAFVGVIANGVSQTGQDASVTNENFTASAVNGTRYQLNQNEIQSDTILVYDLTNNTQVNALNYTLDADNGFITMNSDALEPVGTSLVANYSYYPDNYVNQSAPRTIIIAIVVLLFIVGIFSMIKKKGGK